MTDSFTNNEFPIRNKWNTGEYSAESLWWHADEKTKENSGENIVFLMVPGNPGVIDYYISFLTTIHEEHERKIDIIGVSNIGHSHEPQDKNLETLYSLQDQIDHKIQCFDELREKFSRNNLPPKVILCGHSIGAYICSQVLKARPNHGIINVYSLFPTLQHMRKTPNGVMLNFLFGESQRNLASSFIQSIRYLLAPRIFKFVVKLCTFQSEPQLSVTAEKLLHGPIVKNALYMANTEMETVKELDEEIYRQHLEKFVFYFAAGDNWAPLSHYNDMLKRFPDGNIILCDQGFPHAFVIGHGEKMGIRVASWIGKTLEI
ncbi:438_t:CDS:2 [Acaulospora morrowiae]|uniref:438_t:CDS:1 n=1 Tax=Acaulospora morrowiae TaxID=94023 RepID=A0A9N9A9K2_9GLOM|nr:438_t:CDS:2 [Acaulospora morrowiae]